MSSAETKTLTVRFDPQAEFADVERAALRVQLAEAEEELRVILSGRGRQIEIPGANVNQPPGVKRKRSKKPTGTSLRALQHIQATGSLDHDELANIVFGNNDPENRRKIYSRIRHWKARKWLAKDGERWIVSSQILASGASEEDDD